MPKHAQNAMQTDFVRAQLFFLSQRRTNEPRTESADKSDALQTLRARGRRASVWSACVFSAAFPRESAIRSSGRFMEFSIAPVLFSLIAATTNTPGGRLTPAAGRLSD